MLISFIVTNKLVGRVFETSMQVLLTGFVFICVVLVVSGSSIYYCERGYYNPYQRQWITCDDISPTSTCMRSGFQDVFDGLWWGLVTYVTVGYGDIFPVTTCGKITASLTMLVAVLSMALPVSIISSSFTMEYQKQEANHHRKLIAKKYKNRIQCKVRVGYEKHVLFVSETASISDLTRRIEVRLNIDVERILTNEGLIIDPFESVATFEQDYIAEFEAFPRGTISQINNAKRANMSSQNEFLLDRQSLDK